MLITVACATTWGMVTSRTGLLLRTVSGYLFVLLPQPGSMLRSMVHAATKGHRETWGLGHTCGLRVWRAMLQLGVIQMQVACAATWSHGVIEPELLPGAISVCGAAIAAAGLWVDVCGPCHHRGQRIHAWISYMMKSKDSTEPALFFAGPRIAGPALAEHCSKRGGPDCHRRVGPTPPLAWENWP